MIMDTLVQHPGRGEAIDMFLLAVRYAKFSAVCIITAYNCRRRLLGCDGASS